MMELDCTDEVALLVNVADTGLDVINASRGYLRLMGLASHEVRGRGLQQLLTLGAPLHAVSKSANHDLNDFCYQCSLPTVEDIGETVVVQPATGADGTHLTVLSLLGLCRVHERQCVLVVQAPLGEGVTVRVSAKTRQGIIEQCRNTLLRLRKQLCDQKLGPGSRMCHGSAPAFRLFSDRLQGHSVLSNGSLTATRREKDEIQNGCLVFSDRPIPISHEGLEFSLRVDSIAAGFEGLPLLGFTRRQPGDTPDLYPIVASCLGESVLVGGQGCQAYARDQHEHFVMGFKLPPQHEVQTWPTPVSGPRRLRVGDIVKCRYTLAGTIQFLLNDEVILDFNVERPVQDGARYYAVVDVCFTAGSVTMLPSEVALSELDTASGAECDELTVEAWEEQPEEDDEDDVSPCYAESFCEPESVPHRRSTKRRPTTASMASTAASEADFGADLGDFASESDDGMSEKMRTFAVDFSTQNDGKVDGSQASAPSATSSAMRGSSVAAVVLGSCVAAGVLGKWLNKR